MPDQKRHPILPALLYQLHEEVLDELVELFDRMLQKVISSGDRKFAKLQQEIAGLANDKIKILHDLVGILLDPLVLENLVSERLPEVELTDILIEVDRWARFSRFFEHPNGNEPRSKEALAHCCASILAQACNFGPVQMSRMSGFRIANWRGTRPGICGRKRLRTLRPNWSII